MNPTSYVALTLDKAGMAAALAATPIEGAVARSGGLVLSLPKPDGGFARFSVQESSVVAPELAARFPEIKTYAGQGIDDPTASIRLDLGLTGFHAQVLSPNGAWYIDPYYRLDDSVYVSYFRKDLGAAREPFFEPPLPTLPGLARPTAGAAGAGTTQARSVGTQLRTYRLALAADGEYSAFHGGTVPLVHNALVTAVNRVTGIYQIELAIKLQLVPNNDSLIYLNAATDPYSNTNPNALLSENQATIDSVIESANYDIGHVFTTGGGGLAGLGVVGQAGFKAQGETGSSNPVGDGFFVDYVAHEMGHQFGGDHTFNGNQSSCAGNGNAATGMEPGSGTTIQAYAGICGTDNLQPNSDPYFHSVSFDEMVAYTTGAGSPGNLGAAATTNRAPVPAVTGGPYTIPKRTPFTLTGSATDLDNDPLSYQWEQYNGGVLRALNSASKPSGALFRSFAPTTSTSRTFPKTSTILANNTTAATGACAALPAGLDCFAEFLPTVARTMKFRLTARDNRVTGGGVNSVDTTVTVNAAGPFLVTAPNTALSLPGGGATTVTWNVAGTNAAPINTANVNILVSTDGGNTFPAVLAASTPNDGSETVTLPNLTTAQARIKIEAVGNIYFDVSDTNFTITGTTPAVNDNFAAALNQVGNQATAVLMSTTSATAEASEPGGSAPLNTVWYKWKAVGTGQLTIDTFSSTFDTVLCVYTGTTLATLTQLACNDNTGGSQSQVVLTATSGKTYLIQVDGAGSAVGTVALHTRFIPVCAGLPATVDLTLGQSPTAGNDVVWGTPAADTIDGLAGADRVCGNGGDDTLLGGSGNDRLYGGAGADSLNGGADTDYCNGGAGLTDVNAGGCETVVSIP